jgi:heptosyltransferase-3
MYAWFAGKYRIGLLEDKPNQHWKKRLLNDWVAFDSLNTHTVSMGLRIAKQLGLPPKQDMSVNWTEHDSQLVDTLLTECQNNTYAVLHIYPKFAYKMWHSAGWVELVAWLNAQNFQVILTGSSDSNEMHYIQDLQSNLPSTTLNFSGKLNLAQMAYLLKNAKVYVGPDTVATHLAAAMGAPTVALFGPSNPVKWGPWPSSYHEENSPWQMIGAMQRVKNVALIQGLGDCVPCRLEGCDRHINSYSKCLDNLPVIRVIDAIKTLLS